MMETRSKSDSLMDQVFAAVTLPTVGQTTIVEEHHEESHAVYHHESHHVESHNEHFEYTSSGVTVGGNVVGHPADRRPTVDFEDQRSEVSALSKATSVSVHSSVSQKSANAGHYDLPPIPQYDMPPIVVGDAVVGKAHSTASSKSGSRHSAASHHSHHSQHSHHSAATHDSESTITEGTLVNQPISVGGVVGGVTVGGIVGSEAPTPLAVGQSIEHDAVIEQFKNLHGRDESVVSSIVPASVHMHSDSEDSIAPSKLTHSIAVGGVVGSHDGMNVLRKSHELEYTDFAAPQYYQPPSVQGAFDARSEDSFGFEKVEYVDTVEHYYEPEEEVKQVVQDHVVEHQVYEPYKTVHENHNVPSVDFDEDHHSVSEHHHHDHDHHHHHHDSHVSHTFTSDVKQSRSNTASTYQSRQIFAHNVGPKITEELRPAAVIEEEEVEVKPPVMAYVAPIPIKPPRTHEESHAYNAYDTEVHHYKDVVKSTTVVQEDVRYGSEGVSALRKKFEHGAPPPLSPVFEVKKYEHQEHHDHHHHHHHQDVVVEQVQTQKVSEHVQLGGSRKSTIQSGHHHHHHHHHHENHNDVPSRPSSVASSIKHQPPHSRTSTVSTVRGAPVQRVTPTVQHHVIHNPYGDHQSVRVVKNVREFVNVFGATHVVPPPTPLAGVPRLPPRSPISHETFQPHCDSVKSSRKSSVASIGNGVQIHDTARKSTCSSVTSSRKSSVSTVHGPVIVGGNVVCPAPRSRNATLTQENVHHHHHDHSDGEHELIHVADMRKLFENFGPAHLPEYASSPYAYIH